MSLINAFYLNARPNYTLQSMEIHKQSLQQKISASVKTTHCPVQQNRRKVYVRTEFLAMKHHLKLTSYKAVLPAGCRWHQECSELEPASPMLSE